MRRRRAPKRKTEPDPKHNSTIVGHFTNIIMRDGKKSISQKIIYGCFDMISQDLGEDPLNVLSTALDNARPRMSVKPRRIGGATYQVPLEVPKEKGISTAIRWIKDSALKKKGKPMKVKLAEEIIAAYKNEGAVIKKKSDTHKMAESNRAFAHFRY
ncbi:MAG: 30S ribosomal protein S7 [Candidatus Omnitrophica bacterium]|nr:30S ribosomal protein S7 [Candidatus Omnitrophota bacterium]